MSENLRFDYGFTRRRSPSGRGRPVTVSRQQPQDRRQSPRDTDSSAAIHKASMERSKMRKPGRLSRLSCYVETLWRDKLVIGVLVFGVGAILYVFVVLPRQVMQELRSQPAVTESGRVTSVTGRWSTVQLAHGSVLIPANPSLHIGDTVEVQHTDGFPGRVKSIRRVGAG
jgi:hypothetical protein